MTRVSLWRLISDGPSSFSSLYSLSRLNFDKLLKFFYYFRIKSSFIGLLVDKIFDWDISRLWVITNQLLKLLLLYTKKRTNTFFTHIKEIDLPTDKLSIFRNFFALAVRGLKYWVLCMNSLYNSNALLTSFWTLLASLISLIELGKWKFSFYVLVGQTFSQNSVRKL